MILSKMERRKAPIQGPQNTNTSGWLNDQPRVRNSGPKFLIDKWVNALVMRILWTWPTLACCPSMVRHCTKCYHRWGNQPFCPPIESKEGYLWTPTATKYPTSYPQHLVLIYFIKKRTFQRRDDTVSNTSLCSRARIRESSDMSWWPAVSSTLISKY
jgi:hypothetical protein